MTLKANKAMQWMGWRSSETVAGGGTARNRHSGGDSTGPIVDHWALDTAPIVGAGPRTKQPRSRSGVARSLRHPVHLDFLSRQRCSLA